MNKDKHAQTRWGPKFVLFLTERARERADTSEKTVWIILLLVGDASLIMCRILIY